LIGAGLIKSAHDCSEGGFAIALAECWISHQIARETPHLLGANVDLSLFADSRLDALLFGETQSRIIVSVLASKAAEVSAQCKTMGLAVNELGPVGGSKLVIRTKRGNFEWALAELHDAWWNSIARAMHV